MPAVITLGEKVLRVEGCGQPHHPRGDSRDQYREFCNMWLTSRAHAIFCTYGRRIGYILIEKLMRWSGISGLAALPRRTHTTSSRHDNPIGPNPLGCNFMTLQLTKFVWPISPMFMSLSTTVVIRIWRS